MKKVLKALTWLKENNPFYKDIDVDAKALERVDPDEFVKLVGSIAPDPALEAEAMELAEGEGNPLPQLSQLEPILTQQRPEHRIANEYALEPINSEQVQVGEDVAGYMQKRIKGTPLGHQQKNLDVVSFPDLFPRGRGGQDEGRLAFIRPSEFFAHKLRNKDPRWRRCLSYMQMAHFYKRDRAIGQGIYASTKTGSGLVGLTASALAAKCQKGEADIEKELTTLFATIRGSKEYWARQSSDLSAMDTEFGPATFFLTLSCAETKWAHLEDFLRQRNADLFKNVAKVPIAELISRDHVGVSEFFWRRFKAMMKILRPKKGEAGPLGIVEHYYWRLEYQARGAPHIHMKLWIKDAPVLGAPGVTQEKVQEFISQYITCELPDRAKNPVLRNLVETFQQHKCTSSCMRFKKGKGGKGRTTCRYSFPLPAHNKYVFNGVNESVKSRHKSKKAKKMYQLPRSGDEIRINDYNPTLLTLWGANMDIQYVGDFSRVLNGYITGYMTKGEKNQTEDLYSCLRDDGEAQSVGSRLRSLVLKSMKEREVGIYEIIDALLGHELHGSSDAVEWLGVGMPGKRKRKLLSWAAIQELAAEDPDSTKTLARNLIEDYYPMRSAELAHLSLHDIVKDWSYVARKKGDKETIKTAAKNPDTWKASMDLKGWFRKRQKPVVVKTPYIPCKPERAEDLFQILLQVFVPYRNKDELKAGKDSYAQGFAHWSEQCEQLRAGKAKHDVVEAAKQLRLQLVREAAEEEEAEAAEADEPMDTSPAPQPISATGFRAKSDYATDAGLKVRVDSLNAKQRAVWEEVLEAVRHQESHAAAQCQCTSPPSQVLKFISGGAGVGKSRLFETLTEAVELAGGKVVLAAPSGLAAQNIDGSTIHRAFRLPVQRSTGPWAYEKLSHNAEKELNQVLGKAKLIIIDEVSMVSNSMLEFINKRLNSMKSMEDVDGAVFGGMNVVVLGDLLQLPPVSAPYCFEPFTSDRFRKMNKGAVGLAAPTQLWTQFSYAELTENMRQKGDGEYADLLNRLRLGDIESGMDMLNGRVVQSGNSPAEIAELLCRLDKEGKKPVCLLSKVAVVGHVNAAMLVGKGIPFRFLHAVDQVTNRKPRSTRKEKKSKKQNAQKASDDPVGDLMAYLEANTERKVKDTGGMAQVLALGVGARVMLTRNMDVEKGLFNGAMGTVAKVVNDPQSPDGVEFLVVDFDGVGVDDIAREQGTYSVGGVEVKRSQFPLALSYAITIHKSQGLSLDCVVTDLGPDIFSSGMAYIALSRVRILQGLFLLSLQSQYIWCDLKAVSEYNRLRKAYTDLPDMKVGRRKKPATLQKRKAAVVSRPLAEAGIAANAPRPPPSKKAKVTAAKAAQPPTASSFRGPGFVPLKNTDNRCFVNSAVQGLLSCMGVVEWAEGASDADSTLRRALRSLSRAQAEGHGPAMDTDAIRHVVNLASGQSDNFEDGHQHDSCQFLESLLDSEPALQALFWVTLREHIKCLTCGTESERDVDGMTTVPLKRPAGKAGSTIPWGSLLKNELETEREQRCDVCIATSGQGHLPSAQQQSSPHSVRKTLGFGPSTRHVLVQVDRFTNIGRGRVTRTDVRVSDFKAQSVHIGGETLRTVAAIVHEGRTRSSGHYTALTPLPIQRPLKWLHKSDESSTLQLKFLNQLAAGRDAAAYYILIQRQ